jgi:hypothetical protein
MAILRSLEGTFYEIPDSELDKYEVPPDQVKRLMESAGQKPPAGPRQQQPQQQQQQQMGRPAGEGTRGAPQILVQFITNAPAAEPQIQYQAPSQGQGPKPAAEGEEEKVEAQWYWVNWYNWANWYNWY